MAKVVMIYHGLSLPYSHTLHMNTTSLCDILPSNTAVHTLYDEWFFHYLVPCCMMQWFCNNLLISALRLVDKRRLAHILHNLAKRSACFSFTQTLSRESQPFCHIEYEEKTFIIPGNFVRVL